MKKTNIILILSLLIALMIPTKGFAMPNNSLKLIIDGDKVDFSKTGYPVIDSSSRTQLPFRKTLESMGAVVSWDKQKFAAVAEKDGVKIEVPIGKDYFYKNGEKIQNKAKSVMNSTLAYIPLRVVVESFGCTAKFDGITKTIILTTLNLKILDKVDLPNNKVKIKYADGDTYEGGFVNDMRNGYGTLTWTNGDVYVGEFLNNKRNGRGTLNYANGDKFVGEYLKDKRTNHGVFTLANGDVYECTYLNGKGSDYGTYKWANGNFYKGEFVDDEMSGHGTLKYANGNLYVGDFLLDLMTGKGTFTATTGDKYVGSFVGNKMSDGTLTWADGDIYKGQFYDNKMSGSGTYTHKNGDIYEGQFLNDMSLGKGKLLYANGDVYEGDFLNDKITGFGRITYANGDICEGEFLDGNKIGELPDKRTYNGRTVYDSFVYKGVRYEYLTMTKEERKTAWKLAKKLILDELKCPSTAVFESFDPASEDYLNRDSAKANNAYYIHDFSGSTPDEICVNIYVDAQNSFGAMLRNQYYIKFSSDFSKVLWF